ncbi:MAG: fimbrial biogenesis chaperone [Acidithiobacillus sp.]
MVWRLFRLFLLIATPVIGQAGDFSISPVHVHLSQQRKIAALVLTNLQDAPLTVQTTAQAWSQAHGRNITTDTDQLIISPPLFEVPPHGRQIIRVGLRIPFPVHQEKDYRLILHEVPPPPKPGFMGVQLVLRMILPVFVAPVANATHIQLKVSAHATEKGFSLQMVNEGNIHAEITGLRISENDHTIFSKNLLVYVLPTSSQEVSIPITHGEVGIGKTLFVQIMTRQEEKPIDASVVVAAP